MSLSHLSILNFCWREWIRTTDPPLTRGCSNLLSYSPKWFPTNLYVVLVSNDLTVSTMSKWHFTFKLQHPVLSIAHFFIL